MPLLIHSLGGGDTHINIQKFTDRRNQAHTWFKYTCDNYINYETYRSYGPVGELSICCRFIIQFKHNITSHTSANLLAIGNSTA